ncbi:PRC-barrel domain-containing protein [Bradyrhizobium sp. USDA 4353]
MKSLLLAGAALVVLGPAVMAQAVDNHADLRGNLSQMLQKSGYTDIRVSPSSFFVRAKDQNGNPVVMSISPDQFTEVTAVNDTSQSAAARAPTTNADSAGQTSSTTATYVTVPSQAELSSNLVGLDVYNSSNKDIGEIKDIALDQNGRTAAYIVSVGGFLGMGEHYVAVKPSAVKITYDGGQKKWHASMNATADQLKSAPEFKYQGKWNADHA